MWQNHAGHKNRMLGKWARTRLRREETLTSSLNLGTSTGDMWNRHVKEWKEPTKHIACFRSNEEPVGPALTTRHL